MGMTADGQATAAGERLELRISLASARGEGDFVVHATAADRVDALIEALAAEAGARGERRLWCERRGELLDGDLTLDAAGIRWGDRLVLGASTAAALGAEGQVGPTAAARVELLVTGGPCAGARHELGDGTHRVGRDRGSDVAIDDPSISSYHLLLQVSASGVRAADADSTNGTALGGRALRPGSFTLLRDGDELELGRTLLRVRPLRPVGGHGLPQRNGRLDFNRPPRINPPAAPFRRELPSPPSPGRRARLPLAASLVPLGAGLLLFLLLKSPVMLAVAGLSPIMAVATFVSDRRGGKKSFARATAEFRAALEQALAELAGALEEEAVRRREESPDAPTLLTRLDELAPTLWERRPTDPDFMCLRLGVADLPAQSAVSIGEGGDPALRAEAQARLAPTRTVPSVPVTLDLRANPVAGLAGLAGDVAGLARWLVLQAAILHSPAELVIVAALAPREAREWSWLKWLPHLRPDRVGLQSDAVAIGRAPAEDLLGEVRDLLRQRRAQARAQAVGGAAPPQVLVVIDEETGVDRALVSAALTQVAGLGVAALWLGRDRRDLPGQTDAVVELAGDRAILALTEVSSGQTTAGVSAEAVTVELAQRSARLLAAVRDVGELARAGDIPKRVGLLDLLGLLPPTAGDLQRRWEDWRGDLRATVGVGAEGPLTLDLRSEGPHALIAGTTGSGKSELLRTLVAAASAAIPPHRLSFLLVDYKGGAAFAPCAALPHVADIVSDLDEHMAERALISLNAELKRRERVLAEHGAKDLLELARREPELTPPLLVIAVDEFAKLREEVPEFVDGVVDIAQRGRSLGVHMILAAQTLRNAFTPAIRANTNLRLALRVSEESESEDMIASPLAARIPSGESSRGRAFARTGHGELRELQTAYISGLSDFAGHELELRPYELDALGAVEGPAEGGGDSDADSDLVALGRAAREAQARMGLPLPAPPWVPMLPPLLGLDELAVRTARETAGSGARDPQAGPESAPVAPGVVAIGLIDLPQLQRQDPLVIDLVKAGHVGVYGAGNSGKTTALTSTALALARSSSPEELCIYGLDAASGALAPLAELPHCGGVVPADDHERVQRLLRLLVGRVERGGRAGAWSPDYPGGRDGPGGRAAGARSPDYPGGRGGPGGPGGRDAVPPRTVLLLDDLGSFAHQYDRPGFDSPYERLAQILAGGRAAGVHVMLTASRRGAVPAALAAHLGQRLVLRMPTEEDMLSLGLDAKTVRGARLPPGRGFTTESREFQIAVAARDGAAIALEQAVAAVDGRRSAGLQRIEVLPTRVSRETLPAAAGLQGIPLGISDADLLPAALDLSEMHLLIVGPYRSGRSTALATILEGVRRACPAAALHLLAPRRSPLRELEVWSSRATGLDACLEVVTALVESLEGEGDGGEGDAGSGRPGFVFVDDGGELTDARLSMQLERLVRVARDGSTRVIAAVETGSARGIGGSSWVRELRREGHGLLLQPDLSCDGDLLGASLPRRVFAPLTPGRGFLVARGSAELIQVAS